MTNAFMRYSRPLSADDVAPAALALSGAFPPYIANLLYEGRIGIVNALGDCTVQILSSDLPDGSIVYVDNSTDEVVISWPAAVVSSAVIPNGDFATGLDQWDAGPGWYADPKLGGTAAFNGVTGYSALSSALVSALPNDVINATAVIEQGASANGNVGAALSLDWFNSSYLLISSNDGNVVNSGSGGATENSVVTGVGPTGTAFVRARVGGNRVRENKPLWCYGVTWDHAVTQGATGGQDYAISFRVTDGTGRTVDFSGSVNETVPDDLGDPDYKLNSVLLRGNGANTSPTFIDQMGNIWTANGNAQQTSTTVKYGAGAMLYDGSGDWIQSVVPNGFAGDFTIEGWLRINSLATDGEIFCVADPTFNVNNFNIVFEYKTTGALRGSIQDGSGGANVDITSAAGLLTTGTYYHVCFMATGSTARVCINGVQVASGTITGTRFLQTWTSTRIGRLTSGFDRYLNGRLDDFRVRRKAQYTVPFTPPPAELPALWVPVLNAQFDTSGTNDAQGVTTDGTHVWYSNSTTLFKYTTSGTLVTSRSVTGDAPLDKAQINGMYLLGGVLRVSAAKFVAGVATSWIVDYDPTTLTYITHRQISSDKFSEGIAYRGGHWWVVFHADKVVCEYDTSWNLLATHTLSFPITGSSGGFGPGTGYDGVAWVDNYLLCNIHETYDQDFLDVYQWDGADFLEVARLVRVASSATQGICTDPSNSTLLWYARRAATDGVIKSILTLQ